ncbi:MAG: homoserine kinase [Bacteroidota bacterium]
MAIYTQLTPTDLAQISTTFGIGAIEQVLPFAQGQENSNFRLITATESYVLTICENKSVEETQLLIDTLEHLAKHDFFTTKIIRTVAGHAQASLGGKPLLLKSYLSGEVKDPLPLMEMEPLGQALARLHQVPAPDFLPSQLNYGRQTFGPLRANFGKDHPFLDWLATMEDYLATYLTDDLPRALIHADVFADNVILTKDRGPVIMDFEEAAHYYRLFDLGMTIVGTCFPGGKSNLLAEQALVRGYEAVSPLLPVERQALNAFIVYAATAMASWRFWQFNVVQPGAGKQEHYQGLKVVAEAVLAR